MTAVTETITVDRQKLIDLSIEIDAVAVFEIIRNGRRETPITMRIYDLCSELDKLLGLSDDEQESMHERGWQRGEELFHELLDADRRAA